MTPETRLRALNSAEENPDGEFVVYWMTAARRPHDNFGLERAVEYAKEFGKPLVILEALRIGYEWASDRFHHFVIEGMRDNAAHFKKKRALYYPYVEPSAGDGSGLLEALASRACVVVTDDFPCFFLPRMTQALAARVDVAVQSVDSNGLFPMRATDRTFTVAHSFRRFLQYEIAPHLRSTPQRDPLKGVRLKEAPSTLLASEFKRWPPVGDFEQALLGISDLAIDHSVDTVELTGGFRAAERRTLAFLSGKLSSYHEERNHPDEDGQSGLSPYLHFGHVSPHFIFGELAADEGWSEERLAEKPNGKREGWWGMSEPAEAFLDQFVTWREVGYNRCVTDPDFESLSSLPDWAVTTLKIHAADKREYTYTLEQFAAADTHDPVWNAAQRELASTGVMHNYLRMLWGKKILHWTKSPDEALAIMIELNNRYALDGRNPNSYSGIFWVLGRYDRAWGPERPIFGKVRYMTSDSAKRKLRMREYLEKFGPTGRLF